MNRGQKFTTLTVNHKTKNRMKPTAHHQLEALQNAVNSANLTGLSIQQKYSEDRRKTTPQFYLVYNGGSISPTLDYNTMNHFILGFSKGLNLKTT